MSADDTLTDAEVEQMRADHRSSYPMGNIRHGTPERPDWGPFCVECKESWPCDVSRLLDTLAACLTASDLRAALTADDGGPYRGGCRT